MKHTITVLFLSITLIGTLATQSQAQYIDLPQGELGVKIDEAWTFYHNQDFIGAIDALKALLKEYPDDALIENTIGFFYFDDGNYDEAVKYFQDSLVHSPNEAVTIWNHINLADIFRLQGFLKKSQGHIDFIEKHDLSPNMITNVARIKQDLRISEITDTTVKSGNITIRYPHYLLPPDRINLMSKQIREDWKRVARFLSLSGDESFEVFVFPSAFLYDRFFPLGMSREIGIYDHHQVHTVYLKDGDYMDSLAPYGYYLLMNKFRRYGVFPWMIEGLDDAIRDSYQGISLNSWVSELYNQDKLPSLLFLLDSNYESRMSPELRNPTAGSFIRFLKSKFHPNDFLYMLTQPNLEYNFGLTLQEIEAEWIRYAKSERSLLENAEQIANAVEAVSAFDEPPVVGMDLVQQLRDVAALFEAGNKSTASLKLDEILKKEPRYGDALYLKAKILYDESKLIDAQVIFIDAIKYMPPNSASYGWTAYFLGRIAKLKEDFQEARYFYSLASLTPLPVETLTEIRTHLFNLDKYFYLKPANNSGYDTFESSEITQSLAFLDDLLKIRDWQSVLGGTAYELNSQTLTNFVGWYKDPVRLTDNVVYTHRLDACEIMMNTVKCEVTLRVEYPESVPAEPASEDKIVSADEITESDEIAEPVELVLSDETTVLPGIKKRTREYTRYMLFTRYPDGWRILDYFDEIDLYR